MGGEPRTLYLQWMPTGWGETTWCEDAVNDDDVLYYHHDVVDGLRAEIERLEELQGDG